MNQLCKSNVSSTQGIVKNCNQINSFFVGDFEPTFSIKVRLILDLSITKTYTNSLSNDDAKVT
jgi:hypothetical protein